MPRRAICSYASPFQCIKWKVTLSLLNKLRLCLMCYSLFSNHEYCLVNKYLNTLVLVGKWNELLNPCFFCTRRSLQEGSSHHRWPRWPHQWKTSTALMKSVIPPPIRTPSQDQHRMHWHLHTGTFHLTMCSLSRVNVCCRTELTVRPYKVPQSYLAWT